MTSKFPIGTNLITINSTCLLALGTKCIVVECPFELFGDDVYVSFIDSEGHFVKGRDYTNDYFKLDPEYVEEAPVRTIDVTPTWRAIVPILLMGIENGTSEGKKIAREEIYRMADAADAYNASNKG